MCVGNSQPGATLLALNSRPWAAHQSANERHSGSHTHLITAINCETAPTFAANRRKCGRIRAQQVPVCWRPYAHPFQRCYLNTQCAKDTPKRRNGCNCMSSQECTRYVWLDAVGLQLLPGWMNSKFGLTAASMTGAHCGLHNPTSH